MTALLGGTSFYVFSAAMPVYLNRMRGYSPSTVGLLIGITSVIQLGTTLVVGPLLDRRGARLGMRLGFASYLLAAMLLLVTPWLPAIVAARVLQGIGLALVLPAVFSVVPLVVESTRGGTALGLVGAFNNVALAAAPPLGLLLLAQGPPMLFGAAVIAAVLALLLSGLLRVGLPIAEPGRIFKYRSSWTPLYAITFLCVIYWGVVTAFLPIAVPSTELRNVGLFFTADALAVMAARIPAGYLADRHGPRWLLVAGSLLTALAIGLLVIPPSTLTLIAAGIGTGISAALLLPPILLELTKRSNQRDRGTAMALYNTSFAAAVGAGSLGGALLVQRLSFDSLLMLSMIATIAAAPVALVTIPSREDV